MSVTAIEIEGLGKRYRVGERERYVALRDVLARSLTAPLRLFRGGSNGNGDAPAHIWALRDVSFQVREGETIGFIGRNGAGKSTLLKILARITEPTEGLARVRGRVGSLLEVGTGFHPELTGRENVYLSGAILGMKKAEIDRKFDEIVAFSGVETFLDTPLKHYSSGMQMRLAFAVAAHMEQEVLLVDEVLAVGDLEFQKKCLGKMKEVSRGGRTVVFVSHQMNQMRRLCERVAWIDGGKIRQIGAAAEVIAEYEAAMMGGSGNGKQLASGVHEKARFLSWEIIEPRGEQANLLESLGPVTVTFGLQVNQPVQHAVLGIALHSVDNQLIWAWSANNLQLSPGRNVLSFTFPMLPVKPGVYTWQIGLWDQESCMDLLHAVPSLIVATENYQHPLDEWNGVLNIPCQFSIREPK
jgi:lipopolysaccharide transport system ATP-binding protein